MKNIKLLALIVFILSAFVMQVWGESISTLTFTAACSGSGTADDDVNWTITSDGSESTYDATKGIHYGTNKASVQYIKLVTSDISGTITKVVVNASTASDVSATVSVTIGGSAFGGDAKSLSTTATDYTFLGSASGEIVVTITKPSSATKALYCKSVAVTYSTDPTCSNLLSINKGIESNGTITLSKSGDQATCSGLSVEVTPSPAANYHIGNVTATTPTTGGTPTITSPTEGKYIVTYAANSTGSSTINVSFEEDPQYTITWVAGSNASFHTQTNYSGIALTDPGTPSAATYCPGGKVFVGWTETEIVGTTDTKPVDLFTSVSGMTIPATNKTYYAVFATESVTEGSPTTVKYNISSKNTLTKESGEAPSGSSISIAETYSTSCQMTSGNSQTLTLQYWGVVKISNITLSMRSNKSSGAGRLYYYVSDQVAPDGYIVGSNTEGVAFNNAVWHNSWSTDYVSISKDIDITSIANKKIKFILYSTANSIYCQSYQITYKLSSVTTYSDYATSCCTPLGAIKGSLVCSTTTATLTWNDMSNVDATTPYVVTWKKGSGAYSSTGVGSITTNGSGKKECTITGLTPCSDDYTFKLEIYGASGYCDKDTLFENKSTTGYTYTINLTNVSLKDGETEAATSCDDFMAEYEPASNYDLPTSITVTGASSYEWEDGVLMIDKANVTGNVTVTIDGVAQATSYQLYTAWANSGSCGSNICNTWDWTGGSYFAQAGTSNEWRITNYTIPAYEYDSENDRQLIFNVAGKNATNTKFYDLPLAVSQGTASVKKGAHAGAVGTLRIYDNSGDANGYIGFVPNKYILRFGTHDYLMSETSSTVWETALQTLDAADLTGSSQYQVGVTNSSNGFVGINEGCPATGITGVSGMGQKSGADKWGSNLAAADAGKTGKFRIWLDNATPNFIAHFVPYYQLTYDSNAGTGTMSPLPASPVSAEESVANRTVSVAACGFTAPMGKEFVEWNTQADGNGTTISTGSYVLTSDVTLYAIWRDIDYTVTMSQVPAAGATLTGGTTTAHYGNTIDITTTVPSGYTFTGWTASPAVAFADASATSTSFAMPASSVTVTANFACGVTWMVNGEEWTAGTNAGNTQVANGSRVATLPTAHTSSDCDDSKVFVGWRSATISGVSATDPGSIFTDAASSPAITGNTTFYAVFADVSGGDNTLVTNVSELTEGTRVYIYSSVENFTAVAKSYNTGNNIKAVSGSVTDNKLTPAEGACAYTVGITTGTYAGYTFKDENNKYLRASSTSSNYLVGADEVGNDGYCEFAITISDGVFSITSRGNTSRGVMQFNKNNDTGNYKNALFACYNTASQNNVKLFKKNPLVYSNYVTTCASCDADATFTNTTPAVSAIDCDAATLTMTGGLATLGADGCNVSDYGFVIGTTDNPAIGGSGVTKLQAGTTNPTTGADFSLNATGLTAGTRYYVRAYATNRHCTAYSGSESFYTTGVSSIALTTAPTKTNYIAGEVFDKTGMAVAATMAGGGTETVTGDITCSSAALTAGVDQDFAINYSLCGNNVSVNQKINVYTLTVNETSNADKGTESHTAATITISGLTEHYTAVLTPTNAELTDNGNGTYTVINPTGNVTVSVDYVEAAQVNVYYHLDGTVVTGLTQVGVYQGTTVTLPTASELAAAMTAQGLDLPDDDYPNFVGWSATQFGAQTSEPILVTGTPTINAETHYYAVYTNLGKKTILPADLPASYGDAGDRTIDGVTYYRSGVAKPSGSIQFRKSSNGTGYIYSKTNLSYILKIEVSGDNLVVNACSDASGTLDGDAIAPVGTVPRVYTFPNGKQYFQIKGNGETNTATRIDIYYSPTTVQYMTQFCTRYGITGASTSGIAVTGGTLTSSYNSACEGKDVKLTADVSSGYRFDGWTVTAGGNPVARKAGSATEENGKPVYIFTMPAADVSVSATLTAVFTVTYAAGGGSGTMTDTSSPYEEGDAVSVMGNTFTRSGYTFTGWSYSPAVVVTDGAFVMPAADVTVTATWSANRDVFIDRMHGNATVNRDGVYTVPILSDAAEPEGDDCNELHYHFVGWVEAEYIKKDGTMKTGWETHTLSGGETDQAAANKTYYAVWAEENE